jgi:hypothetical protein
MRVWSVAKTGWVLAVGIFTLFVGLAFAQDPDIHGKFQALGNARLVSGGISPHEKAADLTSNCGAQAYSNTCYSATPPFTFSGISFTPKGSLTVAGITTLSTDYNFGGADCGGGAPRFEILLSGGSGHDHLTGFIGPYPNFTNCYYGWLNTGNFANSSDTTTRWQFDLNNVYIDWATVQSMYASRVVTEIDIVLDSGWLTPRGQDVTIDNFTVNNKVLEAEDAFPHPHDHD